MTVRISTGLRNKMLAGGVGGGVKGALDLGFLYVYSGPQPLLADTGATGTLLGTTSINGLGVTGLTFGAPALGVLAKDAAEVWKFNGEAAGTAGYCRFAAAGDTPANTSATAARIDMSIATSGSDVSLSNISITVGAPNTVDVYQITMPSA
jgi:hypothetical protein